MFNKCHKCKNDKVFTENYNLAATYAARLCVNCVLEFNKLEKIWRNLITDIERRKYYLAKAELGITDRMAEWEMLIKDQHNLMDKVIEWLTQENN